MNEVVLSRRAQLIYEWIVGQLSPRSHVFVIPALSRDPWIPGQAGNDKQRSSSPMPNGHSMADSPDFQTSRTDDLVRAGQPPPLRIFPGETLNPHAADYWQLYYFTIQCNLSMFDGKICLNG